MKKIEISNNCEKCAYFAKERANFETTLYCVTEYMECNNTLLTEKEQTQRLYNLVVCKYWQPIPQTDKRPL